MANTNKNKQQTLMNDNKSDNKTNDKEDVHTHRSWQLFSSIRREVKIKKRI